MEFTKDQFIERERASRDVMIIEKKYIDLVGERIAGDMLSQIVFWHLPDRTGKSKLRVKKEGKEWMVRTYEDWWEDLRLTKHQARRAIKILCDKGLVEKKVFGFSGKPTVHLRIKWNCFLTQLQMGLSTNANGSQHNSNTEYTTEYTNSVKEKSIKKENSKSTKQSTTKQKPTNQKEKSSAKKEKGKAEGSAVKDTAFESGKAGFYRQFKHLKITYHEVDKLKQMGYSMQQIDRKLDQIENYRKNDKYSNLYLTVKNRLEKDDAPPEMKNRRKSRQEIKAEREAKSSK